MSAHTKIHWADSTTNPTMGCGGCELGRACYAWMLTERYQGNNSGFPKSFLEPALFPGRMLMAANWPDLRDQGRADKPWLDGLPRIVFISDMGDALSNVAGHEIPFEYLKTEIIDNVAGFSGCRHLWVWPTKRPGRMVLFDQWLKERDILWPGNLIAATSIVTAATASARINNLKKVRAKYRALSVEPLWEPVTLDLADISWIFVGGESAQGKVDSIHQFDLDWARSLRDQCLKSDTAFFFKQAGSNPFDGGKPLKLKDHHGGDWDEFPADLRIREVPEAFRA